MAVDVCSEIPSLVASPRISFSHDLKEADSVPVECHDHRRSDALLLESIDFNFSIGQSFQQELSSADELFANGKILPVEVKKITSLPSKQRPSRENLESKPISACLRRNNPILIRSPSAATTTSSRTEINPNDDTKKKSLKEFLSVNSDDAEDEDEEEEEKKPPSKPFWQFRRSSSLNFDTCRTNSLIRSLHFLSRSNSTGSAPNPKPSSSSSALPKVIQKQHSQKEPSSMKRANSSSLPSCSQYYSYKSPSLRKNNSNGHGVRISPVLHIPHACISRNSVLLGFSSLFCNGKSKKKKKSL